MIVTVNGESITYTYGDDLISQSRGATTHIYHYDGLGSTRALSGATDTLTDTYDYDAFGELLNQTGSTENNYLFTGEQYDPNLGQYYLRARYYNPATGRFTQMDAWMGVDSDPITLNKYVYANVDPVNMVDPSGYFAGGLGGFGATSNTLGILANTAIAGVGAFALKSIATSFVESGNGGSLIGTSLERLLNRKTLGPSLATARARAQAKVQSRAKGRRVLFHYTTRLGAIGISACRCIRTTIFKGRTIDGLPRPRGAYATDLAPWNVSLTQTIISQRFFGGSTNRVGRLGWYVAVDAASFFPYGVPNEYVKPVAFPLQPVVPVDIITTGPSPAPLF